MALVIKKLGSLVAGGNPYENKAAEKIYNSKMYGLTNFSYIFELDKKPEVCMEIFKYIKGYQHLIRDYNCSTVSYNGKTYVLPPVNQEITVATNFGYINITALSRNGLDFSGFRIAEPIIALSWRWGVTKLLGYLETRCTESLIVTDTPTPTKRLMITNE